jgi:hypothetical protein
VVVVLGDAILRCWTDAEAKESLSVCINEGPGGSHRQLARAKVRNFGAEEAAVDVTLLCSTITVTRRLDIDCPKRAASTIGSPLRTSQVSIGASTEDIDPKYQDDGSRLVVFSSRSPTLNMALESIGCLVDTLCKASAGHCCFTTSATLARF